MIRTIFYLHVTIAIYCLAMAILDGMDNPPFSIIPPLSLLTGMVIAAVALPFVNLVLAWRARVNGFWLLFGHVLASGAQILFGIVPLFV